MQRFFYFIATSFGVLLFTDGIIYDHGKSNSYFRKLNPPPVFFCFFAEPDGKCAPKLKNCDDDTIFYTYDGSCNNLKYSYFGQAKYPFERILAANFTDGYEEPRVSVDGSPLPSPRQIRTTILPNAEYRARDLNSLFYAFGQYNNHDASFSKMIPFDKPCCKDGKPVNPLPYECFPTIVPADDEFYSKFGVTCVDLKRSMNTKHQGCSIKPIRQTNSQTAVFDLSILYGTSEEEAKGFRLYKYGLLKAKDDVDYPFITSGSEKCPRGGLTPNEGDPCFYSGDLRTNQNPGIFLINVIFFRLHNYLAKKLGKINPHWCDEELYHMARRTCIAMYQQVFGAEFVPAIIGSEATWIYRLYPATFGYVPGYDSSINPQTFHEFTSAVGRSGHSLIRGAFRYHGSHGSVESYRLREKFFNINFFLKKEVFLGIVQAHAFGQCNEQDQHLTEEVNNYLFPEEDLSYGNDLSTIDIGRGREFGLQGYNRYRVVCGLKELRNFEDLADEITDPMDIHRLKRLYHHVDDIDLYVGGLMEKPFEDSTLGPTFTCILGAQFHQWKFGDRKYFEFPTARFTHSQLQEIRAATFAQLLCITVPQLKWVPKNAFYVQSDRNPVVHCSQLPGPDLRAWKDY